MSLIKKKMKRSLIKLSLIVFIVLFLAYVWVPYSNGKKTKSECYKGIVLKKYYKRGNILDVKLETGKVYSTHSVLDSDFDKISIGDTVVMRNGEFIGLK